MPKKLSPARRAVLNSWMGECGWKAVAEEVVKFQNGYRHPPIHICPACGRAMPKTPGRKPRVGTRYKEAGLYDCMVRELIQIGEESGENIREAARRVAKKHGCNQSTARNNYFRVRDTLSPEDRDGHRNNLAKYLVAQ